MSIWKFVFDNEWVQRADIEGLKDRSRVVQRQMRRRGLAADRRIDELEDRVGELTLLCRALLTALLDAGQIDVKKFDEILDRIDLEDGVRDGKVGPGGEDEGPPPAPKPRRRRR